MQIPNQNDGQGEEQGGTEVAKRADLPDRLELAKSTLRLENDPVLFAEVFLKLNPYSYQVDFLRDTSKRIVICAGRRIGKSTMVAVRGLWLPLMHPNTTTLIISATLRQSIMMFDTILNFIAKSLWIEECVKRQTRTMVSFGNGSKIKAYPCGRGKGIRGENADLVIVDEASFVPDEVIGEVILPMLATTDGTIIMLSTPFDKNHIFYKAFISERWSKYHYLTSINQMVKQEFLNEQRELIGGVRFRQEYEAEFVDDERSYFPQALIRPCLHTCEKIPCDYCYLSGSPETLEKYAATSTSALYGGYDPGGKGDPAALVLVEKLKDEIRVILVKTYLAELHGKKIYDDNLYTRFTSEIADINQKLKMKKLYLDQTGLGQPIVEQCKALKLPAEGLNISSKVKEELLSNLRILFENKKIVLPSADRELNLRILSNLNCIEFERKPSGGYVFSHPSGIHDDIAFALALAVYAASGKKTAVVMMKDDEPPNPFGWRYGEA